MIRDARVLQDDFLPREIAHRHEQMERLAGALEPVIEGDRPQDAMLEGPSGAGKTCVARYSLDELSEWLLSIDTQYVDCWQHSSRFRVLYKLLEGLDRAYDIHRSTPRDELLRRLDERADPYVVVLDEVDQLEDIGLLRELFGIQSLTTVLISNRRQDVLAGLDERLQSRIRSCERVRFDAYTTDQLTTILADRVGWGLEPGAITDDQLRTIADAAGNARDGIAMLRSAARAAERAGEDEIDSDRVQAAIPTAREAIRQTNVDRLNRHQRVLYEAIAEAEEITPGDLYSTYCETVEDPRTERTCRNYLRKLRQYNLVTASGEGRSRRYRVVDVEDS